LKNQTETEQLKKLLLKKSMQNLWPISWDRDKFKEKNLKIITKPIFEKKNQCITIRSYEAECLTI